MEDSSRDGTFSTYEGSFAVFAAQDDDALEHRPLACAPSGFVTRCTANTKRAADSVFRWPPLRGHAPRWKFIDKNLN